MRTVVVIAVTLILMGPIALRGQTGAAPDRASIQKLLSDRDDARHKGDWNAFGQFYTTDATSLNSAGVWLKGRAAIQKDAQDLWGTGVYKGARMKAIVESVETVAPTVVIADSSFEISNIAGGGTRKGRTTVVLVRSGAAWKIAATRSMVPTPVGAVR